MAIKYNELLYKMHESNRQLCDLKRAINDETLALLQYMAGIGTCKDEDIKKEFDEHAKDEYRHAFMFYEILHDLGGEYFFNISTIMVNNECGFKVPFGGPINKIMDNIKSEECAIVSYERLLKSYEWDKKHSDMITEIINDEKEHREDLFEIMKENKKKAFDEIK
jgi:bacterioferritin